MVEHGETWWNMVELGSPWRLVLSRFLDFDEFLMVFPRLEVGPVDLSEVLGDWNLV